MKKFIHYPFLFIFFVFLSCNSAYRSETVQYNNYRIKASETPGLSVTALMKPYSDSINKSMNQGVGYVSEELEKKQPESSLGNFLADALLVMAREKYATSVDAAFINFGGVRLTQLPVGPVTRGKIFELMPFDNLLIIQKIKGDIFQKFLDLVAARGGWPCAGFTMQIKDKKAVNVLINGKLLDPAADYVVANSDYVANGGDDAEMLRTVPQQTNGYLMRDAFFDYIAKLKEEGKDISAKEDGRVTYAK